MTNPKMRPCPKCGATDRLAVYTYPSGWRHVECNACFYLGPGEGTIHEAIKSHNKRPVDCRECGGSGFSGYGTGYDAVCGNCGGQKQLSA